MADNTRLSVGSGGDLLRSEDVGPYKIAVSKIYIGAAGIDGGPVTTSNPLPVSIVNFPAVQPVSGTVAITGTVATSASLVVGGQSVSGANPLPVSQTASLPSGTNTIGGVIAQASTGVIYNGTAALTPKFVAISAEAAGDNTLVAAVPGKRLRVLKYTLLSSGFVGVKFRSGATADLTGSMPLAANSGVGGAYCPAGLFETATGDPLVVNLSAGVGIAGHLTYIEV